MNIRKLAEYSFYVLALMIPVGYAIVAKWYLGVWGFAFEFDPIGVFVILLQTGPFWALAIWLGLRIRKKSEGEGAD